MATFLDVVKSSGKGADSKYRPPAGTTCEISGPNQDDDSGYRYIAATVCWVDENFIVWQVQDCWPNVNKWEHVLCRPLVI